MAEDQEQGQVKSEEPTMRRREESREQGQVAFSQELNNGVLLLAGALAAWMAGTALGAGLRETVADYASGRRLAMDVEGILHLLVQALLRGTQLVGLFFAVAFFVGLAVSLLQAGVFFAPQALAPKWRRISPIEGLKRIFSMAGVMRGVLAILKVVLIAVLVVWVVWGRGPQIASLAYGTLAESVAGTWQIAVLLLVAIGAALVLVGILDYFWQHHRHEESMRMTRQELKDELKRDEGDPLLRARRRGLAREIALQRKMIEEVPKATVVVTNPTHLAVALRYVKGVTPAPQVLAKGRGEMARQIAERARRHSVPVVERKGVAQALFKAVRVGDEIPVVLYYAVSEVLAFVYRLRGNAA